MEEWNAVSNTATCGIFSPKISHGLNALQVVRIMQWRQIDTILNPSLHVIGE
jgi:hypothetical protein